MSSDESHESPDLNPISQHEERSSASRRADKSSRIDSLGHHSSHDPRRCDMAHKSSPPTTSGHRSKHRPKSKTEKQSSRSSHSYKRMRDGEKRSSHKSGEKRKRRRDKVPTTALHSSSEPQQMSEKRRGKLPATPPRCTSESEVWIKGLPPHIMKQFERFMRHHPVDPEPNDADDRVRAAEEPAAMHDTEAQAASSAVTDAVGDVCEEVCREVHETVHEEVREDVHGEVGEEVVEEVHEEVLEAPAKDEMDDEDEDEEIVIVKWEVGENRDIIRSEEPEEEDELDPSDAEEHEVIVISDDDEPAPKRRRTNPPRVPNPRPRRAAVPTHRPAAAPNPAPTTPARTSAGWTANELVLLHRAALTDESHRFIDAVPGRTQNQCESTWRNTIYPAVVKFLRELEE